MFDTVRAPTLRRWNGCLARVRIPLIAIIFRQVAVAWRVVAWCARSDAALVCWSVLDGGRSPRRLTRAHQVCTCKLCSRRRFSRPVKRLHALSLFGSKYLSHRLLEAFDIFVVDVANGTDLEVRAVSRDAVENEIALFHHP